MRVVAADDPAFAQGSLVSKTVFIMSLHETVRFKMEFN